MDIFCREAVRAIRVLRTAFWSAIIAVVLISVCACFVIGKLTTKSYESVVKEKERQAVVNSLTPEQRKALGL